MAENKGEHRLNIHPRERNSKAEVNSIKTVMRMGEGRKEKVKKKKPYKDLTH